MSFWSAVVAIVAILAFTSTRIAKYRSHGTDLPQDLHQVSAPREAELEREVIALRQRLEVLERITTDAHTTTARQSQSIAAEIESLRDR